MMIFSHSDWQAGDESLWARALTWAFMLVLVPFVLLWVACEGCWHTIGKWRWR